MEPKVYAVAMQDLDVSRTWIVPVIADDAEAAIDAARDRLVKDKKAVRAVAIEAQVIAPWSIEPVEEA